MIFIVFFVILNDFSRQESDYSRQESDYNHQENNHQESDYSPPYLVATPILIL